MEHDFSVQITQDQGFSFPFESLSSKYHPNVTEHLQEMNLMQRENTVFEIVCPGKFCRENSAKVISQDVIFDLTIFLCVIPKMNCQRWQFVGDWVKFIF